MDPLDKLKKNIEIVASRYFLDDHSRLTVADGKTPIWDKWNVTAMMLAMIGKKSILSLGEPGSGKTTASALVGCASTGLPYDLWRSLIIPGHPDQCYETMIARLDFGALQNKIERVIWQKPLYFPLIQLDEVNRLSEGKQSELLDAIAIGRFPYANEVYFDGPKVFMGTANYTDGGNHVLTPAMLDRFNVSLEFKKPSAIYDDMVEQFQVNMEQELSNADITTKILEIIQDKNTTVKEKLKAIEEQRRIAAKEIVQRQRAATGSGTETFQFLTPEEEVELKRRIKAMECNQQAKLYLKCIDSEINNTGMFGVKRSCDPVDGSNHGKGLASYNTLNGASFRAINQSIKDYARALAVLAGADQVGKQHIDAVAPYALAHRLKFTEDFRAMHAQGIRVSEANAFQGTTLELHLAKELLKGVGTNFGKIKDMLLAYDLYHGLRATGDDRQKTPHPLTHAEAVKDPRLKPHLAHMEDMVANPIKETDHPLLRDLAYMTKELYWNK